MSFFAGSDFAPIPRFLDFFLRKFDQKDLQPLLKSKKIEKSAKFQKPKAHGDFRFLPMCYARSTRFDLIKKR